MDAAIPVKSLCWWAKEEPGSGLPSGLSRGATMVAAAQSVSSHPIEIERRVLDLDYARTYSQQPLASLLDLTTTAFQGSSLVSLLTPAQVSEWNYARRVVDSLTALVASTKVRPRFVTFGAKWKQKRRAKKAQRFADGLSMAMELHDHARRAFSDSQLFKSGKGVLFFDRDGNKPRVRRLLPSQVRIDPQDGLIDGRPRTVYVVIPMSRDIVRTTWGKTDTQREAIDQVRALDGIAQSSAEDLIEVWLGWHLRSGPEAKDGWHTISVDHPDGELDAVPFEKDKYPLRFCAIEDQPLGFWGSSVFDRVYPIQMRINRRLARLDRAERLMTSAHLYFDKAAKVSKLKASNEIGTIWEGSLPANMAVAQLKFDIASEQVYRSLDRDCQEMFDEAGVPRGLSAGVQTDVNPDASGAARREARAHADQRSANRQSRWEAFQIECLEAALDIVRDIAADGGKVKAQTDDEEIDWGDIALDRAAYRLEIEAASPEPLDPAARRAAIDEAFQRGDIDAGIYVQALETLDQEYEENLSAGAAGAMEKIFDRLLYDDDASEQPDEFTNAGLALKMGVQMLNVAIEEGVPDEHLERLRKYLRQLPKAQPPAPAASPAQGATPVPVTAGPAAAAGAPPVAT